MTNRTNTLTIRLNTDDRDKLAKYITRKSLESILRQIENGEVEITENGINIGVYTSTEGVNTTLEPISGDEVSESIENSGVNTCDGCPYFEASEELDTSNYLEACHTQGVDAQKALDKYTQSMWRQG